MEIRPSRALAILLCAGLCIALGAIAVVLGTGEDGPAARPGLAVGASRSDLRVERHLSLSPVLAGSGRESSGTAFVVRPDGGKELSIVVRAKLPENPGRQTYEAWLYNSVSDAQSLGALTATKAGVLQGGAALPRGYLERWRHIDVSRETVPRSERARKRAKNHSGESVLRGELAP